MALDVSDLAKVYWSEIAKKCLRATVFIDNPSAECLHWSGGLKLLEPATRVLEFSSFESACRNDKKGVFIVSNPALSTNERILKDIISNSSLEYCIVITSCQPNVLTSTRFPGRDFNTDDKSGLEWLEDSLLDWMGNRNYTVEILYYPIFTCPIIRETFFTPSYHRLYPLLENDITKCQAIWKVFNQNQPLPVGEGSQYELYPQELKIYIRQLVANLHSLFGSLRLKEDIWSVGPFAKCVGEELEGWLPARNRRKTAQGTVSLILLDRTLDLAGTVVGAGGESVLSNMLQSHQNLPGHNFDISVDLSKLLRVFCSEAFVPSSLGHAGSTQDEDDQLRDLIFQSEKQIINSYHTKLAKHSPRKSDSRKAAVPNVQNLGHDLAEYEGDLEAVMANLATVSRAQALINCSNNQDIVHRKRLQSLAAQFTREIQNSSFGVLEQITELVLGRGDTSLSLTDILKLLLFVYSVPSPDFQFREEEAERLKSVLGEEILRAGKLGTLDPLLLQIAREEGGDIEMNELVALNTVNRIWTRLEAILAYRSNTNKYASLIDENGMYNGFISQLLTDIYHPNRIDVPDLHYHAGGLGAILRSGLGWLGAANTKQHPRQNPWVLVFVLGGVTPLEIKQSQTFVAGTESKLTLAATNILTPLSSLNLLFNNNPLFMES
eukprot:TRINITY_DN2090_c0_g1_i11.p1 TRINITY_DN2090_c0_g1~~TRINITY_DN2090_c0_g1_i11.p1  ORF type:complete len:664 (-),score=86.37 TRINITY_DN2090_c0_g1_i11:243-2234(-)